MCDEVAIYISPLSNWKVIKCSGLWGIPRYVVEYKTAFWQTEYDGENSVLNCFKYLYKNNIISKDELKYLKNKWRK